MTTSHKTRSSYVGNPEAAGRSCACGKACRPHTMFCGDECRFWAKVQKGPGCWLWIGSRSGGRKGKTYGQFSIDRDGTRVGIGAHIYAYELTHGPVPAGLSIRHTCDVPLCVRNDGEFGHLLVGDHTENMRDAVKRGRLHVAHPGRQQLTPEQIYALRARVASGETHVRVANDYGISETFVTLLMQGKRRQYDAPLQTPAAKKVG
jgi:hypothetical protein